jgi:tripartite-type tricarboxylate transporter receptor subunit TctC
METWVGYFVRSGTPPAALERLRGEFERVVGMPETTAALEKRGFRPMHLGVREASELVRNDIDKWSALIRKAGISAD